MARTVTWPPADPPEHDGAKTAGWWQTTDDSPRVLCNLCPRHCEIAPGKRGFCFVRQNRDGRLVSTTYGRSTGFCIDPIEKKPLNHFHPGSAVLSFGTPGCNLGCKFCQNWTASRSRDVEAACDRAMPRTIARAARELGCQSVAFTYNDPIIWAEYAIDTARACRDEGIRTVAVTSGYITRQARGPFHELIDAANVDLKAFTNEFYRQYAGGAELQPVLDTLQFLVARTNIWLEITTLLIPGLNDSPDELEQMCAWIAGELGPDVPIHFTAFHPDFEMRDRPSTPPATLRRAHEIAKNAGLHYVYTGNVHDPERQSTHCPGCGKEVVHRDGYRIGAYKIVDNQCRHCGGPIAGRFNNEMGDWGERRQPVRIEDFARPADEEAVPPSPETLPNDEAERIKLSPAQDRTILHAAARRVAASVRREHDEPLDKSLGELADMALYGAFVSLKRNGQLRSCCGYLGDGIRLSEAVGQAARRAALDDPRFPPITAEELPELRIEVWLLFMPRRVAARGEQRVAAVEIGRHGLQIARGSARGLLLPGVAVEHGLDARQFLEHVCVKAGLRPNAWRDDETELMTFEGYAVSGPFPRRSVGRQGGTRPAAVAGMFYPANPAEIERTLDEMIPSQRKPQHWDAAIVPHAGWVYSGGLAAQTLARVVIPERVIVLCPRHRPVGANWSVAPFAAWQFPHTSVAGDPQLAAELVEAVDGAELDTDAHRPEHAIEVQLPFLARLNPQVRVTGVAVGGGDLPNLLLFGRQLAGLIERMERPPLLVVSTDMNHFADDRQTRQLDRMALDAVHALDPEELYQTVRRNNISMCGMLATVIAMEALRQCGRLRRVEEVGYTTSAEQTGDTERVVGYAGLLLG